MHNQHGISLGLILTGSLLIALSFASGLRDRVESARWIAPETTPVVPPVSYATPPLATPAPVATSIAMPTYPLPVPTVLPQTAAEPVALAIPAIGLEAPIVPVTPTVQQIGDQKVQFWPVPDMKAAGWQVGSARPGSGGNTVLNGHNTTHGEVFRALYRVPVGALIYVTDAQGNRYGYRVSEIHIVPERDASPTQRLENARFIMPTPDERLTLITCHPYGSTRYRLIVIAHPYLETCAACS